MADIEPTQGTAGATRLGNWQDATTPAIIGMAPTGDEACLEIEFTSDGSVDSAACEAAAGAFGWVARSATDDSGWGAFGATLAGAGRVPGHWWEHTSTRAEAAGLLDAMKAAMWMVRQRGMLTRAIFSLDNEAVVKQC